MQNILRFVAVLMPLSIITACQPIQRFENQPARQPMIAAPIVEGWMSGGAQPDMFEFFMDSTVARSGQFSGSIRAVPANDGHAGASGIQRIRADEYRGKRIHFTGWIKTENVTSMAGLFMTIMDDTHQTAEFDGFQERQTPAGDTDWTQYEIVLDVPENAIEITFGGNIGGKGQAWFDDLQIEVVGPEIAPTMVGVSDEMKQRTAEYWEAQGEAAWQAYLEHVEERLRTEPTQPVNLDFEAQ